MSSLLFLGTGAADWSLSERNGFFRRNSAALVNGKLLLDCGDHIFDFAEERGQPGLFSAVTDVLITHCHGDHFSPRSVRRLASGHPIRLWGCEAVGKAVGATENVEFHPLTPFAAAEFEGFSAVPVLANHDVVTSGDRAACHFILRCPDGKTIFYGLDGAWFLRPSWEEMKKHRFDVMVLDCTVGDLEDWRLFEHNTVPMLRMMAPGIRDAGMLAPEGRLVASHLARTLHPSPEETERILSEAGFLTAYDGLELRF